MMSRDRGCAATAWPELGRDLQGAVRGGLLCTHMALGAELPDSLRSAFQIFSFPEGSR